MLKHSSFIEFNRSQGVTIDRKLSFWSRFQLIFSRNPQTIGFLYRISLSCPKFIVRRLYNAFILPYMNYCIVMWGDAAKVHLDKLLTLQKRAVRIITGYSHSLNTGIFLKIDETYRVFLLHLSVLKYKFVSK